MNQYEDLLVDALLDDGFTLDEAMQLIALQEQIERRRVERMLRFLVDSPVSDLDQMRIWLN